MAKIIAYKDAHYANDNSIYSTRIGNSSIVRYNDEQENNRITMPQIEEVTRVLKSIQSLLVLLVILKIICIIRKKA